MSLLATLAVTAALYATSYLLRELFEDDLDDDPGDRKKRGSTTVAQEGDSLALVIGRARVRKTNILLYQSGDETLREYLQRSVTSQEGQHKVDMILGVCARPVENVAVEFNTMWVGDTDVFPAEPNSVVNPIPASNANGKYAAHRIRYQIRQSELFGGPGKGGGIGDYSLQGTTIGNYVGGGLWCLYGALDQEEYSGTAGESTLGSTDPNYPPAAHLVVQGATDFQLTTGPHYGGTPGVCTFILRDFQIGETPSMPGFSWEMTVCPDYSGLAPQSITSTVDGVFGIDANPMAALYMVLTDNVVGLGIDASEIDAASFNTAANTLDTEKNGFSYASESKTTGKKLVDMILKQIEGILFMDPDSLTLKVKLVRNDFGAYPYAGLPVYDDSNVVSIVDYKESTEADVYNQVRVKFQSRSLDYNDRFAVSQNPAIATTTGRIRSIDVHYPGVKGGRLANEIAIRELVFYSSPQLFVTLQVMRSAITLRPGDLFKWVSPEYNISGFMVLRIHKVSFGTLEDGTIELICSRDKYANQTTTFADPPSARWDNINIIRPPSPGCQVVQEAPANPYFGSGGSNFQTPEWGTLLIFTSPYTPSGGGSPTSGITNVTGASLLEGNQYASTGESTDSTDCGKLDVAYSTPPGTYYDTITGVDVYVRNSDMLRNSTEEEIRHGRSILLVGNEYMSYESFTDLSTRPAFRDSDSAVTAINQTDIIVPVPAGVVDGDLMIAIVNLGPQSLLTAPAGWSHITDSPRQQDETVDNYLVVMTKIASSEPANYTWARSASHLRKITGSIVAFSDAVLDFSSMGGEKVSVAGNTIPSGTTMFYVGGSATDDVEFALTAISLDLRWEDGGSSKIDTTEGFTELHDLVEADTGQLQIQYTSLVSGGSVDYDINLNLVSTNTSYNFLTLGIKGASPASNVYRLNNVWRGLFDTAVEDHAIDETAFFFGITGVARKMTQKKFVCDGGEIVLYTQPHEVGVATGGAPTKQFNGLVFSRRDQRPTRPTSFMLRNDGADAEASEQEVDYAYNANDYYEVVNTSTVGEDTKISSGGVYGDVWSNDLRGMWNRRPKIIDCAVAIVRGDDADSPYGLDEGTSLRAEVKGTQEGVWETVAQRDIQSNPIIGNTDFIDLSTVAKGPGVIRLSAFANALDTGEELRSHTSESLTIDVHSSRQLLLNRNFVPYWDVDGDSSVSYGDGKDYPGNPVYQARGWTNITSGGGRPRYKIMSAPLIQGDGTQGFAFTGEFVDGEYIYTEQIIAVPYLDTEGSEIELSWWFMRARVGDEFTVSIDTLDANGAVLDTSPTTQTPGVPSDEWSEYTWSLTAMSAEVRSIQVKLGLQTLLTSSGPAIGKISMVMGREIDIDQLLNSDFDALTNWVNGAGGTWTLETSDGALVPVDADKTNFVRAGATDSNLYQDVDIPPEYGTGDYIRIQYWTANTGSPGYGYMVMTARDSGAGTLDSITVGGDAHPNQDQWYFHEGYLKIPGECEDVRILFQYKDGGGGGSDFAVDQPNLTFIKGGHS